MKKSFDISIVKRVVDTDNGFNISIMRYARERIDALWHEGKIRSWKKYRVFCNKLIAFLEQSPEFGIKFPVRKISVQFVSRFESYLRTSENRIDKTRILHNNTVVVNIQVLKTLVNRAIKIDGLLPANYNPFLGYSLKRCSSSRERLTLEEIDAIRALQLEEDSIPWNARNMFLFSFYCAGIRVGDLLQLKWENVHNRHRHVESRCKAATGEQDMRMHPKAQQRTFGGHTESRHPEAHNNAHKQAQFRGPCPRYGR